MVDLVNLLYFIYAFFFFFKLSSISVFVTFFFFYLVALFAIVSVGFSIASIPIYIGLFAGAGRALFLKSAYRANNPSAYRKIDTKDMLIAVVFFI